MIVTSPMLSFESAAFPIAEDEDAETNPGIFGKSLAEWLSRHLRDFGVSTGKPFAEDWGWCIELRDQKYRTGLACASEDDERTTWRVFAFLDLGFLGQFRGKEAAALDVNDLLGKVRELLSNEPSVTNLRSDETA